MNAPSADAFHPADPAIVADPYPWYECLRERAPVHRLAETNTWIVTRYDSVAEVLRDWQRFPALTGPATGGVNPTILLTLNPPDHTRLRRVVARDFGPQLVRALEPLITSTVDEEIDALLTSGSDDVIGGFAYRVPLRVIAAVLGVPTDREDDLRRWSDAVVDVLAVLVGGLDAELVPNARDDVVSFVAYLTEVITAQRGSRTPDCDDSDVLAKLCRAADEERLTDDELVSLAVFLLFAGQETTMNLLGSAIHILTDNPRLQQRLAEQPDEVEPFVEEVLRYQSPIQRTARRLTDPGELDGVAIPEGATLLAYIGAANRDPRRFDAAEVFDPARLDQGHLAFGAGIHFCLGAPLARLEAAIALRRLLRTARVAPVATRPAVWKSRPGTRGLKTLPVAVELRHQRPE